MTATAPQPAQLALRAARAEARRAKVARDFVDRLWEIRRSTSSSWPEVIDQTLIEFAGEQA